MPDDPDDLDGCDLDFTSPNEVTADGEQTEALVMFADVDWLDGAAVARRKAELDALAEAGF